MAYVRVALDVPLERVFDYRCDDAGPDDVGRLVVVPFGRGRKVGVVLALTDHPDVSEDRIRPVHRLARNLPVLPGPTLDLLRFCHRYYHHPLGATVANALPTALRRPDSPALGPRPAYRLSSGASAPSRVVPSSRAFAQHALMVRLADAGTIAAGDLAPAALRAARVLLKAGWIEQCAAIDAEPALPVLDAAHAQPAPTLELTSSQQQVIESVRATFGTFRCHLLHGVTGSGKTEVYLRLIEAALARGQQALLLVPEINLTPQLEAALEQRFGAASLVTLLHYLLYLILNNIK